MSLYIHFASLLVNMVVRRGFKSCPTTLPLAPHPAPGILNLTIVGLWGRQPSPHRAGQYLATCLGIPCVHIHWNAVYHIQAIAKSVVHPHHGIVEALRESAEALRRELVQVA